MSVLQCARKGCENIMCDIYHVDHGYICESCFGELIAKGSDTDIEEFYKTSVVGQGGKEEAKRKFGRIFKNRHTEDENWINEL